MNCHTVAGIACVLALHDPVDLINFGEDTHLHAPANEYVYEAEQITAKLPTLADSEQLAWYVAHILNEWIKPQHPWDAEECLPIAWEIARVLPPDHPIARAYFPRYQTPAGIACAAGAAP